MSGQSQFDSPEYSPMEHLGQLFPTAESLKGLQQVLNSTNFYKKQLNEQTRGKIAEYQARQTSREVPVKAQLAAELGDLKASIVQTQAKSLETAATIDAMISPIKKLDDVKKKLLLTMNVFKRLQMLIISYTLLSELVEQQKGREAENGERPILHYQEIYFKLDATLSLMEYFKPYKPIKDISRLSKQINELKYSIIELIFVDFNYYLFETRFNARLETLGHLNHACLILDLLDGQSSHHNKDKLVNWYIQKFLSDIFEIFRPTDEAGSLENLTRRFTYFKKTLTDGFYESHQCDAFPAGWNIGLALAEHFVTRTRDDLREVLRLFQNSTSQVEILLKALQESIDFEKYLLKSFADEEESAATLTISGVFVPHLSIWIKSQEPQLDAKFLEFLSAPKFPAAGAGATPHVIPSSAELFKRYKSLISQAGRFSVHSSTFLADLSRLFKRYLQRYLYEILVPILPTNPKVLNDTEAVNYLTLVLNTAEYCSSTVEQLEERINAMIQSQSQSEPVVSFDDIRESYLGFIVKTINLIVENVSQSLEISWREMVNNPNWATTVTTEETDAASDASRYVAHLSSTIEDKCQQIFSKLSKQLYMKNLCDRFCELLVKGFANNLTHLKPINVLMGEQLLLDLHSLKDVLSRLPDREKKNLEDDGAKTVRDRKNARHKEYVNRLVGRLNNLLKIVITPIISGDEESFINTYFLLMKDQSTPNYIKVLELKGISP
ncbi:hypothetical protein BABINDRAFT_32130, partial [Babjeviella inositovora NRRL Y-12698]